MQDQRAAKLVARLECAFGVRCIASSCEGNWVGEDLLARGPTVSCQNLCEQWGKGLVPKTTARGSERNRILVKNLRIHVAAPFSKPLLSTTQPPLRSERRIWRLTSMAGARHKIELASRRS